MISNLPNGWMNKQITIEWVNKVLGRRLVARDSFECHIKDTVNEENCCYYIFIFLNSFSFYLVRCPTSYKRAQNTRLHRYLTREILHIASLAAHTTLNTYNLWKLTLRGHLNTDVQAGLELETFCSRERCLNRSATAPGCVMILKHNFNIIIGGCTKYIQAQDDNCNKLFKDSVKALQTCSHFFKYLKI